MTRPNAEIPTSKVAKNECRENDCENPRQNGSSRCAEHALPPIGPRPAFTDEAVNLAAGNPQEWL